MDTRASFRKMFRENESNEQNVVDEVDLKTLPEMSVLRNQVQLIIDRCTWWDKYGVEWANILLCFSMIFLALKLMSLNQSVPFCVGVFIYGMCLTMLAASCGHAAIHGMLCQSPAWRKVWLHFFVDICGATSGDMGYDFHVRYHHPDTNIIGLGDSSTYRMPMLPAMVYMFFAPIFLPLATIPVTVASLWRNWFKLFRYVFLVFVGYSINVWLLMKISGFNSVVGIFLCSWASRAVLTIPYIHVNIFQHIGLPMYSNEARPVRIYQMTTASLNLPRNLILDWCFGYTVNSCHIEHHLFPKLSNNMCKIIQPTVATFLKESTLPYHEDTYFNRLLMFTKNYDELMVQAPPITHFVGIN